MAPLLEAGAVYVGHANPFHPKVHHWDLGTGIVLYANADYAVVEYGSDAAYKHVHYATAISKQLPKLLKTGSLEGKTCLANVKVVNGKVLNRDDGKLIGLVGQMYKNGWYFQLDQENQAGFPNRHQAVKALIARYNAQPTVPLEPFTTAAKAMATSFADVQKALQDGTLKIKLQPPSPPSSVSSWDGGSKKPPPLKKTSSPSDATGALKPGDPHPDETWKGLKQEISGDHLTGKNPVYVNGEIVAGEVYFHQTLVGYTKTNGDGTMQAFHADGTLVIAIATPGSGHATNAIAAHHTMVHSGAAEKLLELHEQITNVVKLPPAEVGHVEGGLYHHPHLAYTPPKPEQVQGCFDDVMSTGRGNRVYDFVTGAHELPLTTPHQNALTFYTANGYAILNSMLRTGKTSNVTAGTHVISLDELFGLAPVLTEAIEVYRGIDQSTAKQLFGAIGEKVGQTFVEPGYSSCSALVSTAFTQGSNIIIRTTVPRGSRVVKPSAAGHFGDKEREIILPRLAHFLVMRDEVIETDYSQKRQLDLVLTGSALY